MRKIAAGLVAGLCVSLAALCAPAYAQNQIGGVVVFGDSLSDNGNIPKLFGVNQPPPPFFMNRFSNGPVYAEYLDALFKTERPLMDFAIGGATSGTINIGGLNTAFDGKGGGVSGEIDRYIASKPTPRANDLFIVFAGANDYFRFLPTFNPPPGASVQQLQGLLAQGQVNQTVSQLVTDVTRLAALGVKNFVVPNLPNLGSTPALNGTPTTAAVGLLVTQVHNATLAQALSQLQKQLHVNITIVDVFSFQGDIIANPTKYNIDPAHTRDQCLLNQACVANRLPYLFFDSVHPTFSVQQLFSQVFFSTVAAPTTVGVQTDLLKVTQREFFDQISSRIATLRLGAAGFTTSASGAAATTGGDKDKKFSGFVSGTHAFGDRSARTNEVGFDYDINSLTAGIDYRVLPGLTVGGIINYASTDGTLQGGFGRTNLNSIGTGIFATYNVGPFFFSAAGTGVFNDFRKIDRNTFVANQTAEGTTHGRTLGGKLEAGYVLHAGNFSFGPVVELRYAKYRVGAYAERGAVGLNQQLETQDSNGLTGQFGLQTAFVTTLGDYQITPQLRVALDHEFRKDQRSIVSSLVSQPTTNVVTKLGAQRRDSARIGGGVDVKLGDSVSALLDFDGTAFNGQAQDYSALARVKFSF